MKILVFGASGMLGNALMRRLSENTAFEVWGTIRSLNPPAALSGVIGEKILCGIDVLNTDDLITCFGKVIPDVVINAVGLVKQLSDADDPLKALPINSILPHRLAKLCESQQARLVHVSTDCVFSGQKGNYSETDLPDAGDLYGLSKYMGEVSQASHAITLRTSIIGHELSSAHGLIGWFLAQKGPIKGYRNAIFSGLPTVELADVIEKYVLPNNHLHGVFNVAAQPISKLDLLILAQAAYGHQIKIIPDENVAINRSLNATRFCDATGYRAPDWDKLVSKMREFN